MTRIVSIVGVGSTNRNWKRAGRMQSCNWTPSLWPYLLVLGLCPWFRFRLLYTDKNQLDLEQWKRLAVGIKAGRRSKETRRSCPRLFSKGKIAIACLSWKVWYGKVWYDQVSIGSLSYNNWGKLGHLLFRCVELSKALYICGGWCVIQ